ncbi:MAG: PfaD family polyunsaturated fatty acid/polyketide biosynthesis protein [Proteobacteria bacterium]|nr:PfaD family polyunsaturated fatty acid/polyketide biosynthesis protein [Pseudomonadota bacterium]
MSSGPMSYPAYSIEDINALIPEFRTWLHIVQESATNRLGLIDNDAHLNHTRAPSYSVMATLPPLYPEWLGDRSFLEIHSVRFPYVAGAMYRGLTSSSMVSAMAHAGMLGFFGSAGLSPSEVEKALVEIESSFRGEKLSYGSNLIHSPTEPALEDAIVDLYLKRGVHRVSASAFMSLSPSIVRYSATGLFVDPSGNIQRTNHVFAKLSRPEVADFFMSPPPKAILDHLVSQGKLTQQEATLALKLPVAEDITVEADSGGHTDNRPLTAIFPTIFDLRNKKVETHGFTRPIRLGAAGGLGTPSAVAAAFSMGAAYVLTGSVNQSAVESGLSLDGRKMLAAAGVADVTMAPAADMFELGVKVQVLKRGTLFSSRAGQLWQLYSAYDSIESIPAPIRAKLEKDLFHSSLDKIWSDTHSFFSSRNPGEIEKAEKSSKYRMALIFRWYLGNSANWAMSGDTSRRLDYQICTGPSMGAFNAWVKGSYLENVEDRTVVDIALNLMEGAAVVTRAQQLRTYGLPVLSSSFSFFPRPLC